MHGEVHKEKKGGGHSTEFSAKSTCMYTFIAYLL